MMALPSPNQSSEELIQYNRNRIRTLTTEQLRLYPFAFNLMDAPSESFVKDSIYLYWQAEEDIQKCRNNIQRIKGNMK